MAIPLKDGRALVKVNPTTRAILNGTEDLTRWTESELEYGAKRGPDGRFRRKPAVVAKAVHDELVRRKMTKAYDLLKENVYRAVQVLVEIATDKDADPAIRVKAAETILDRTLGKPVEAMKLEIDAPWQQIVAAAIIPASPEVVDGEVVEDR